MDIRSKLVEAGVSQATVGVLSDAQVESVARSMGIALPRKVEIKEHKGAWYVVTEGFEVPKYAADGKAVEGRTSSARNLFLRVEAIDQAIEDLIVAKGLLEG